MDGSERSRSSKKYTAARTRGDRIRQLNDEFRATLVGGKVVITPGIHDLGASAVAEIISGVREFQDFKAENDPYREHDFGCLRWNSHTVFWKIDYYDLDLSLGSPNPADPLVTTRVLTIMLAREY